LSFSVEEIFLYGVHKSAFGSEVKGFHDRVYSADGVVGMENFDLGVPCVFSEMFSESG
jgi:hypothetical protein